jgi:hypothetical protein
MAIHGHIDTIPALVQALNQELRKLEDSVREVRTKPSVSTDLDMSGYRIKNLGKSREAGDATPRSELQERGLFENELGQHVAQSTIIATDGVRSASQARDGNDLVPLRQLKKIIGTGAGGLNAVLTTEVDQVVFGYKFFRQLCLMTRTLTLAAGENHNVNLSVASNGCFLRIAGPTAAFTITGQLIVLYNATTYVLTLRSSLSAQSVNSYGANRLHLPATDVTIRAKGSMILVYSSTDSKWVSASFA